MNIPTKDISAIDLRINYQTVLLEAIEEEVVEIISDSYSGAAGKEFDPRSRGRQLCQ